jgi:hypothetical protein
LLPPVHGLKDWRQLNLAREVAGKVILCPCITFHLKPPFRGLQGRERGREGDREGGRERVLARARERKRERKRERERERQRERERGRERY